MGDLNLLKKFAEENNIDLSEKQLSQFDAFRTCLMEKNKVMNLTAIREPEDIEIKHFIDSLTSVNLIKELKGEKFSLVDLGTGGGFPGIPLKIVFPEADFTLVDSVGKKINFVNEAIETLGLKKIKGVASRAEDLGRGKKRESFDLCTSRAVAKMEVLLEYCLPLVKVGGYCILYKNADFEEELKDGKRALKILGGRVAKTEKFELPKGAGSRGLIVIRKEKAAPVQYPRRPGKPSKSPIKNLSR